MRSMGRVLNRGAEPCGSPDNSTMEEILRRLMDAQERNANEIAVLREGGAALRRDLDVALVDLREIRNGVQRVEMAQERRAAVPLCGTPNRCVELEKHVRELATVVQSLVENRAETRGGTRVAMALAALAGTVGGTVLTFVGKLLVAHHAP